MTAFTMWKFDSPDGAADAVPTIERAEADGLVKIIDHALVSWPEGAERPETKHGREGVKHDTAWGAFWGVLLGALFLVPVLGAAGGAALGALAGSMRGVGLRKADLERIRAEVTPGTSALFVVTESADLDRLGERFRGWDGTLVSTNLTDEERSLLLETFGDGVTIHRATS